MAKKRRVAMEGQRCSATINTALGLVVCPAPAEDECVMRVDDVEFTIPLCDNHAIFANPIAADRGQEAP